MDHRICLAGYRCRCSVFDRYPDSRSIDLKLSRLYTSTLAWNSFDVGSFMSTISFEYLCKETSVFYRDSWGRLPYYIPSNHLGNSTLFITKK